MAGSPPCTTSTSAGMRRAFSARLDSSRTEFRLGMRRHSALTVSGAHRRFWVIRMRSAPRVRYAPLVKLRGH